MFIISIINIFIRAWSGHRFGGLDWIGLDWIWIYFFIFHLALD